MVKIYYNYHQSILNQKYPAIYVGVNYKIYTKRKLTDKKGKMIKLAKEKEN